MNEWRWSSCPGYYGNHLVSKSLVDCQYILKFFSDDLAIAKAQFIDFNERYLNVQCLDEPENYKRRLSDEEARLMIKDVLGGIEIAQVKSLPKLQRNEVFQAVKKIKGLSQRQAARILGVSASLIFKA
ncbi:hypothetical protein M3226_23805 [Neobacillus cucumis]|uniref:hypothetical protein n=1 Tax=Neobacillus cucumis TaxID=1740721 RepID=UPI00203FB89A|nr:hypothetical protein [Neobacillus cucumis]MCM3728676.1 hypothetical protein [Neobacillus cucumis]